MYPNRLNLSSDYGTLKNDSTGVTISITIPNGLVYNSNNPIIGETTITIGTKNAPVRARGITTRSGVWSVGTFIYSFISQQPTGGPVYDGFLLATLFRSSPTQMTLRISGEYVGGGPNVTIRETQTITFVLSTFLSPTDS